MENNKIHYAEWALPCNMSMKIPVWKRIIKLGKLEYWKRLDWLGIFHTPKDRKIIVGRGWMWCK